MLRALASTVKPDHTAPQYRYVDDPYLTPVASTDKRAWSLSKESGRRAAMYFFEKYPEHFHRDISEPKIEAFTFRDVYEPDMKFELVDLQRAIACQQVDNAIVAYEGLLNAQVEINNDLVYDLLDLVCFHNAQDPAEVFVEEDYFKRSTKKPDVANSGGGSVTNVWKDNGFAERLFDSIKPKTGRAYSSIISGMVKHGQYERAFAFYHQAFELGLVLNTTGYNSLIEASYSQHSNNDDRWRVVTDLLTTMESNRIQPNLSTLNAVLKQIWRYRFWAMNYDTARKTLNEFAFKHQIQPSLGTFNYMLGIFYRNKAYRSNLIYEIVDHLEQSKTKAWWTQLHDDDDFRFFSNAMDVAYMLNDPRLGHRLNRLLTASPKLVGNSSSTNNYYNRYLKLLATCEPIDNFMAVYSYHVPNLYTPNIEMIEQVLKLIKIYKATNYIERLWDDIQLAGYGHRMEVVAQLLATMDGIFFQEGRDDQEGDQPSAAIVAQQPPAVVEKFADIVTDLFGKVNLRIAKYLEDGYSHALQWSASALSDVLAILVRAERIQMAGEVLAKLDEIKLELIDQAK